jgi:hypothetical protein
MMMRIVAVVVVVVALASPSPNKEIEKKDYRSASLYSSRRASR